MSLPTFSTARDEILGLFLTAWAATEPLNDGEPFLVDWPGLEFNPPQGAPWARIRIRHASNGRQTLAVKGQRRIERTGVVVVQVFAPLSNRARLSLLESLAIIARTAFDGVGTASGIWFRNTRIVEIGPSDDGWDQMNVLSEFSYDELV